jgi:hypothetical protein
MFMRAHRAPETREQRRARLTLAGIKDVWCADMTSPHDAYPFTKSTRANSREEAEAAFARMTTAARGELRGCTFRIVGMVPKEDYTQ